MNPGLLDQRVIIVLGKGGVGRTTVAAAIAAACARRGRRTLFYQTDAGDRAGRLFGTPPLGEQIVPLGPNLHGVNTNPAAALHEYGLMVLRYETVYRLVFENQFAKKLIRAIPGLDDYAILGKLWFHSTESLGARPAWDTIVFDAPATGHALTMFKIPRAILAAVPSGPLTRDAVKVSALLEDPKRTAAVIVTLAEEMPTAEALELDARLGPELGLALAHVIVNQVPPDRFAEGTSPARVLDALLATETPTEGDRIAALAAAAGAARDRRRMNEEHLARLRANAKAPLVILPMLATPRLGREEHRLLSQALEEQLAQTTTA